MSIDFPQQINQLQGLINTFMSKTKEITIFRQLGNIYLESHYYMTKYQQCLKAKILALKENMKEADQEKNKAYEEITIMQSTLNREKAMATTAPSTFPNASELIKQKIANLEKMSAELAFMKEKNSCYKVAIRAYSEIFPGKDNIYEKNAPNAKALELIAKYKKQK